MRAEPEVVRCRRWTVVLRRCRDARSRRAAPLGNVARPVLGRCSTSRALARCLAGRRVEPLLSRTSLLAATCYQPIQYNQLI